MNCSFLVVLAVAGQSTFPVPHNTQEVTSPLLSHEEAVVALRLPAGFHATLFAAEPAVQQPIAMAFDARGRLWVAENYTYAERSVNHDLSLRDRIVILEDSDHDGRFDRRTVFWDQGQRLTSIEIGFGGVWALCAPDLLFIPDADGDDRPDHEATVVLNGWAADTPRHNFVNGLKWGPDGWLYGRHGILDSSVVGIPGAIDSERTEVNCGIWRFHPVRKTFEVVAHGTTNPWGSDWDDYGEMFFINTVIGHLWHVIPGAHYERMFGEDANPHSYELIEQTADHYHWDRSESWQVVRKGLSRTSSQAGGGHAHSGMSIYLGANWPDEYRNDVLTWNFHGRRINRDHLERHGATYVGRHGPNLIESDDTWFRGIELAYGPDGGLFILDWSDLGECHENDGVHRSSGRVFKVVYDRPATPAAAFDLASLSNVELVALQLEKNDWYPRMGRRILQERSSAGSDLSDARAALEQIYAEHPDVTRRLRALWCLSVTGTLPPSTLLSALGESNEHLRAWAVRLLFDEPCGDAELVAALTDQAKSETSGLVLTYMASALQRLPLEMRWQLAAELVTHAQFAADPVLARMIWYGMEPAVAALPERAVELAERSQMPMVTRSIARRVTYELETEPAAVNKLVRSTLRGDSSYRFAVLTGMERALRGWLTADQPQDWPRVMRELERDEGGVHSLARQLSIMFGDGRAADELLVVLKDDRQDPETRRQAIRVLVSATKVPGLGEALEQVLLDGNVGAAAVGGLAALGLPQTPDVLINHYGRMVPPAKLMAIEALAARPSYARRLLEAVSAGKVEAKRVSPFLLRQMQFFGDADIDKQITTLWPHRRLIQSDKLKTIRQYQQRMLPAALASADLANGGALFEKTCAKCHKLFGAGGAIGPDLTGAQRTNLSYLLENIVDPSASLAASYRMSIVLLEDGRILNGVIGERTGRTITLQTPTEKIVLDRAAISEMRSSELSLMPEGLLTDLSEEHVRDLLGYLMR